MLLGRKQFKQLVFERDNFHCVVCHAAAVDAHHIMERRLFIDGGYYINNGASVCADCHIRCEATYISPVVLYGLCGINTPALPTGFDRDTHYDKWGNIQLRNGTRLKGPLFNDESVQKILGNNLAYFVDWVKYPKTPHLSWSRNRSKDDIELLDKNFDVVVVTEKMDGENTSIYTNHIHARSLDSQNHPSRNWVKRWAASFQHDIPAGWRVCGENLYAKHSIGYTGLPHYFLGFSIWNEKNECLSWKDTLEWFTLLGITSVPVLWYGDYYLWCRSECAERDYLVAQGKEGYVIRNANSFPYTTFTSNVAKFVRDNHVQTDQHWMNTVMEVNGLKD